MKILRNDKVDTASAHDVNMHGRRTRNASDAILRGDYVTLGQVTELVQNVVGVYELEVDGVLAIGSDLAASELIIATKRATLVNAKLKDGPVGADLIVKLYQNAVLWATATIPAGSDSVTLTNVQLGTLTTLLKNSYWRLDITQVGTTTPGSDLSVTIGTL